MALSKRDTLRYRWEFMRRNPDYRRLHRSLKEMWNLFLAESEGEEPADSKWERKKAQAEAILDLEQEFKDNFGLESHSPLDPEKPFEEMAPRFKDVEERFFAGKFENSSFSVSYDIDNGQRLTDNNPHLVIRVDLSLLNKIGPVLDDIKRTLVRIRKLYDRTEGGYPAMNAKDYDQILLIGDLYEKHRSIKAVADLVYPYVPPDDPTDEKDPRVGEIKVSQHLKTYRHLVSGGWKKLSFP